MWRRSEETDSGWIGADPDDDLDRRMAEEDAAFDLTRPHVTTALGPIEPGALGVTLAGERLAEILATGSADRAAVDPRHALLAELEDAHALGVRSLVVAGAGLDEAALAGVRWVAERAPVHLVALRRVGSGAPDRSVASGVAWGGLEIDADATRDAADALVAEMRSTGMAARIHAETTDEAVAAVELLREAGADPARLWVGNVAWTEAADAAERVLRLGAAVAFDRLLDGPGEATAALAASLLAAGWADRVLLSSGVGRADRLQVRGHPAGVAMALETFPLALMETGVAARDARRALVDAPARLLTIHGEDE